MWVLSWFESVTRQGMSILLSVNEPFEAHDRVDVSHRVFNIPYTIPVHHETEVVVGVQDCAAALSELWRVAEDFNIPVNYGAEVRMFILTIVSRVSARGGLEFTGQNLGMGAYMEKPFVCITNNYYACKRHDHQSGDGCLHRDGHFRCYGIRCEYLHGVSLSVCLKPI